MGTAVRLALLGQAAVMFAVTNIDDIVVLAVFFGRAVDERAGATRVIVGQYLGFVGILTVSVLGALGANLLPEAAIPYLGVLPLLLGLRAAWQVWRSRGEADGDEDRQGGGAGVFASRCCHLQQRRRQHRRLRSSLRCRRDQWHGRLRRESS
jgi:cadmium resistance transporter